MSTNTKTRIIRFAACSYEEADGFIGNSFRLALYGDGGIDYVTPGNRVDTWMRRLEDTEELGGQI